jgi:type II secretory pathway component PulF
MLKKLLYSKDVDKILQILSSTSKAGVPLNEAVEDLLKSPNINKKQKEILLDIRKGMRTGKNLKGLSKYISSDEYTLLNTYYTANRFAEGIEKVMTLKKLKKETVSGIISAVTYPTIIFIMLIIMLKYINVHVMPILDHIAGGEEKLKQASSAMSFFLWLSQNSTLIIMVSTIVLLIILYFVVINKVFGEIRKKIDNFFPFSIYRLYIGTVYLFMLSSLLQSGLILTEAITVAAGNSKYLKNISKDILRRLKTSDNFGEALKETRWFIPDKDFVELAVIISTKQGFDEKLRLIANEYIENLQKRIKKTIGLLSNVILIVVGLLIMLFTASVYSLISNITAHVGGM